MKPERRARHRSVPPRADGKEMGAPSKRRASRVHTTQKLPSLRGGASGRLGRCRHGIRPFQPFSAISCRQETDSERPTGTAASKSQHCLQRCNRYLKQSVAARNKSGSGFAPATWSRVTMATSDTRPSMRGLATQFAYGR